VHKHVYMAVYRHVHMAKCAGKRTGTCCCTVLRVAFCEPLLAIFLICRTFSVCVWYVHVVVQTVVGKTSRIALEDEDLLSHKIGR
jgi:hypothetical protein